MEDKWRWLLIGAIAPMAWGSTYVVTRAALPAGDPFYGALFRALPAGLLLLLIVRRLPRGSWWWRCLVLGVLNVSAFLLLVYVAAQLLPSGVAVTVMSLSATVLALFGWIVLRERPPARGMVSGVIGTIGVAVTVAGGSGLVSPAGIVASVAAMICSSLGFVLTKRWARGESMLAVTAWQILAGALVLLPFAVVVDGPMPALDGAAIGAAAYVSIIATALAYVAWFAALEHLPVAAVGLIGLLNPVTGVLLGVVAAGEAFGLPQAWGLSLVIAAVLLGAFGRTQVRKLPDARGS